MNRDQFRMDLWIKVYTQGVADQCLDDDCVRSANTAVSNFDKAFPAKAPATPPETQSSIGNFKSI